MKGLVEQLNTHEGELKGRLQESGSLNEQMEDFIRRVCNIDQKVGELSGKVICADSAGLANRVDAVEVRVLLHIVLIQLK